LRQNFCSERQKFALSSTSGGQRGVPPVVIDQAGVRTGLDDPASLTPIAGPQENTTYTLHVVSQTCGEATSSVLVKVFKSIDIPNTFSPNGDGINDYWDISALIAFPASVTTVYSRGGQRVYQSTGYAKPWDGTYGNAQLPAGTYYYIVDLKNGQPPLRGWVLIVR